MALPLLVSKKADVYSLFKDDYALGWLFRDAETKEGYWITFGSCSSLKSALATVKELFKHKGQCDVFISDTPLPEHLMPEQVLSLKKLTDEDIEKGGF